MKLGTRFDLRDPIDRVAIASTPPGYRFLDQHNRLWLRKQQGWEMTLGGKDDKRQVETLTLYARPPVSS